MDDVDPASHPFSPRGAWRTYTTADGLAGLYLEHIAEDRDGCLWIATPSCGVSRFDGEEFRTFTRRDGLPSDFVGCVLCDRQGRVWLAGADVCRYEDGRFHALAAVDGRRHPAHMVFEDREGRIWFAAGPRVGYWRDGAVCDLSASFQECLQGTAWHCWGIAQDRQGNLWFGGQDLVCYDGQTWRSRSEQDGLGGRQCLACTVAADADGVLWAARDDGLWRHDGRTFHRAEVQPSGMVRKLQADRSGRLWICGVAEALCHDGGRFHRLAPPDGLPDTCINSVCQDHEGQYWLAAWGRGLVCFDPHGLHAVARGMEEEHPESRSIVADQAGVVWAVQMGRAYEHRATMRLGICDGDTFRPRGHELSEASVPLTKSPLVVDGAGRLWAGDRHGLHYWTGDGGQRIYPRGGDDEAAVTAILGGLSCFDGSAFRSFTLAEGLPNNCVHCLCLDPQGRLWLGMDGAAAVYDGRLFQPLWIAGAPTVNDLLVEAGGDVLLATRDGILQYSPQSVAPRVRIEAVRGDRTYRAAEPIVLSSTVHQVQFEYKGLSLRTLPQVMGYTCRLHGFDRDWQPPTRQRRAFYPALPVGEYTFEVKAIDRDLNESEPAAVRLTVEPDLRLAGLTEALSAAGPAGEFVGASPALRRALGQLRRVAGTDATVLVLGETGTGKGLAARAVHSWSTRASGPFIHVPCGSLPEGLVESELFGHEKGAFTGALRRKLGKIELARGGTLFLDEIGDMPLATQAKLLRLLEEGTYERVGGTEELSAQVRVVAATNRNLEEMVAQGTFREDLFYRVQVVPVRLPPLRERADDIPLLATYFMEAMAAHLGKGVRRLSPEALARLRAHTWPGNVRELQHVVQRAVIACQGDTLQVDDILLHPGQPEPAPVPAPLTPAEYERRYLRDALDQAHWVVKGPKGAAALLGMPESTLRLRMGKLGLSRP
ncbi:MAG: sigma 54-interacting transcriptional regulator [Candidatus Latescibacterota bacterium]